MKNIYFSRVVFIIIIFYTVLLLSSNLVLAKDKKDINLRSRSTATTKLSNQNVANVVSAINQDINNDPDGLSVAVSLVNLNSNQVYNAGAITTVFKAASTEKVLTAIDYLHQVETDQASLNTQIDGVSAEQLMQQMIEVSDDNAWHDLNNFLGEQQQTYGTDIGLSNFTGDDYNTMTASDMAKLLRMFYEGKLINSADQSILLNFMANTTSTNLIQAVLPNGSTVYHKYGQVWGYLNDAAIVKYQNYKYVLVIYTNNQDGTTDEYNDQVNLIQQISQLVFKDITSGKA